MKQEFTSNHTVDHDGNPSGGLARSIGIWVDFQRGPLGRGAERVSPNGAFVETLIAIAKERIEFYQTVGEGRFACEENQEAIDHLQAALDALELRTAKREARGVEGTHES